MIWVLALTVAIMVVFGALWRIKRTRWALILGILAYVGSMLIVVTTPNLPYLGGWVALAIPFVLVTGSWAERRFMK